MTTSDEQISGGTMHQLTHQWDDEMSVGERIVAAVAEYEGTDSETLPPIKQSINPVALDELFNTTPDGDPRPGCVMFSYHGYTIIVQSTGQILIRQRRAELSTERRFQ